MRYSGDQNSNLGNGRRGSNPVSNEVLIPKCVRNLYNYMVGMKNDVDLTEISTEMSQKLKKKECVYC